MVLAVMFLKAVEKLILIVSQSFLSQEDIDNFEKTRLVSTWPPHLKEIMAQFYSNELFQELWTKLLDIFAEIRAKYDGNNYLQGEAEPDRLPHADTARCQGSNGVSLTCSVLEGWYSR